MTSPVSITYVDNWQKDLDGPIIEYLNRLGIVFVGEAREIVPIDTGALHDSIEYEVVRNNQATGTFQRPELEFGATEFYASDVEYGHHTRNGGWVDAQPFIGPVISKQRGRI